MTSQVVLVNASGIAIASDSAVSTNTRVLNGVEKIFPLPAPHKLAIVLSNRADFMLIPWENIIPKWIETIKEPLESVVQYWFNLRNWLEANISAETSPAVKRAEDQTISKAIWLSENYFYSEKLLPFLKSKLPEDFIINQWGSLEGGTPSPELIEAISQLIPYSSFVAIVENIKADQETFWEKYGIDQVENKKRYSKLLDDYIASRYLDGESNFEDEFMTRFPYASELSSLLREEAVTLLAGHDPDCASILCFAGFGENDLLPSLFKITTFGGHGQRVQTGQFRSIPSIFSAEYMFLGQSHALENLMRGYDETVVEAFLETERKLNELRDLYDTHSTSIRLRANSVADNEEVHKKIANRDLDPDFYQLISSTPLKNLATFAGSLVSIQASFATITQNNPTVGGAIDTAIINLSSGFVWINHEK